VWVDTVAGNTYNFGSFTAVNDSVSIDPYAVYRSFSVSSSSIPYNGFWLGKLFFWLGDSIMAANKSQQVAISELGIISVNGGISGSCITPGYGAPNGSGGHVPSVLEVLDNCISSNPDGVYLAGGTNDVGYGVPLGTMADVWPTVTFYAAFKQVLKRLTTELPNAVIMVSTPVYGNYLGAETEQMQLNRKLFADAEIEICNLFKVSYIDKFRLCGINENNYTTKLADTIHPTDSTYNMLGRMDIAHIKSR